MGERILVTGGRDLTDRALVYATLDAVRERFGPFVLVHGGARGADQLAHEWAVSRGMDIERVPAEWALYGRRAGPIRNAEMVRRGAALLVAFPGGRGTADCVSRAEAARIPVEHALGEGP